MSPMHLIIFGLKASKKKYVVAPSRTKQWSKKQSAKSAKKKREITMLISKEVDDDVQMNQPQVSVSFFNCPIFHYKLTSMIMNSNMKNNTLKTSSRNNKRIRIWRKREGGWGTGTPREWGWGAATTRGSEQDEHEEQHQEEEKKEHDEEEATSQTLILRSSDQSPRTRKRLTRTYSPPKNRRRSSWNPSQSQSVTQPSHKRARRGKNHNDPVSNVYLFFSCATSWFHEQSVECVFFFFFIEQEPPIEQMVRQ